ncbi:hypothetical protein B0H10DRAFT_505838 [Mycena sp. CBHHK59/15]|nr:hypothetical protein B0H10DRAFT_505838 [Mycena sp. CBHHK59/15]
MSLRPRLSLHLFPAIFAPSLAYLMHISFSMLISTAWNFSPCRRRLDKLHSPFSSAVSEELAQRVFSPCREILDGRATATILTSIGHLNHALTHNGR